MFSTVASCIIAPRFKEVTTQEPNKDPVKQRRYVLRTSYKVSIGADFVLGAAILAIGICATQWNFMPSNLQYAMIGAGSTYLMLQSIRTAGIIKQFKAPGSYLIK